MGRHKELLAESGIQQLKSITRGDNTAVAGYCWAAVHNCVTHSAVEAASFFGITTETVLRWASQYHTHGVVGLRNQPRGHRPMKLNGEKK